LAAYEASWATDNNAPGEAPHSHDAQLQHFMCLLLRLKRDALLPALLFYFDRA
jgi:hypothetical protein